MEISGDNVNQNLSQALYHLAYEGQLEDSRNGQVLVFPEPVLTTYNLPMERVLFSARRNANPFFHLMEALWMLAGRNDVAWIQLFNKQIAAYSDDGMQFNGAYGHRWRQHFGYDQLPIIAEELQRNPSTRRCVLAMWDAYDSRLAESGQYMGDLQYAVTLGSRDAPCNTHCYFDLRDNALNMTVCCRSNDLWWGAYGANAVHFSVLQEVMAAWVGRPVGKLYQFSHNLHLYTSVVAHNHELIKNLASEVETEDAYSNQSKIKPLPMVDCPIALWFDDLRQFMQNPLTNKFTWRSTWFKTVAVPVYASYLQRRYKQSDGLQMAHTIAAPDWQKACVEWIVRKEQARVAGAVL